MTKRFANPNSAPTQRMLRVGEVIRHALAEIFIRGDVIDPDIEGRGITVPEVRMSPDLKLATAYIMPLGGKDAKAVIVALERNSKFLRGEISRRIRDMKFMPQLRFRLDEQFDEADRINRLLRLPNVARDLTPPGDAS